MSLQMMINPRARWATSDRCFPSAIMVFCWLMLVCMLSLFHMSSVNEVLAVGPSDTVSIPANPFGDLGAEPEIIMIHNGSEIRGELIRSFWDTSTSDIDFPSDGPLQGNITLLFSNVSAVIAQGSEIEYVFKNIKEPMELTPSSLSVTAYSDKGVPLKLLGIIKGPDSNLKVDLEPGQYILIATATWLPQENTGISLAGYVSYGHEIIIK